MKKALCLILAIVSLFGIVAISASASSGSDFIISSSGSYDYGGYGYKNDTIDADVRDLSTTNITKGMRYVLRNGSSTSSTIISGLTDRYDSYDFSISYKPGNATTGNKYIWGYGLGGSSYTVRSAGIFYA